MTCAIISNGDELKINFKDEEELYILELKDELKLRIQVLSIIGFDSFYVNCEYGIPLWAAEIICEMKKYRRIQLYIVMPYEEQAANWNEEIRNRYFAVHEKSDSVQMACTKYQIDCYIRAEDMMLKKMRQSVVLPKNR